MFDQSRSPVESEDNQSRQAPMIITVASFKGGVGKTTTAIHIAEFLQATASTLLVDGDFNRSSLQWAKAGNLKFQVCDEAEGIKRGRKVEHIVIDTQARPSLEELATLANGCDLMIIPTTPDALAMGATFKMFRHLRAGSFKMLLTIVPPKPSRRGEEARAAIESANLPIFSSDIRQLDAFKKAAEQGKPVNDIARDRNSGIAWKCYQKVGEEILKNA